MSGSLLAAIILVLAIGTVPRALADDERRYAWEPGGDTVQLGSRPYVLVNNMEKSSLQRKLKRCLDDKPGRTDFSIGHRGAPMQFPEHTRESYEAAARQGAGILECDVTFTRDGTLVCRHSECDLHTTTDILLHDDIAAQCSKPFVSADLSPDGKATALCCTSDIDIHQYRRLKGKMDGADTSATTVVEYVMGPRTSADWRTTLYDSRGTLLTHAESIALFKELGVKFTPELKEAMNEDRLITVFGSQAAYAQKMIDEYRDAGISPREVWAQSFDLADVDYWIRNEPRFGEQAVYLDGRSDDIAANVDAPDLLEPNMREIAASGVNIIAPPLWALLTVKDNGKIVPSPYAKAARKAGLDIIAWTFERSDLREGSESGGWYWQFDNNPNGRAIRTESDMYEALHVLATRVRILGIFSDWPATVTYYANCMGFE